MFCGNVGSKKSQYHNIPIQSFEMSTYLTVWLYNPQTLLLTACSRPYFKAGHEYVWGFRIQTIKWGLNIEVLDEGGLQKST